MSRRKYDWRRGYQRQFGPLPVCMGGPKPETDAEAVPVDPVVELAITVDVASSEPEPSLKPDLSPDTTLTETKPPARAVRHGSQWQEDRLETLRKLVADGLSFREIATCLNMSPGAIAGKCHRLGLRTGRGRDRPAGKPGPGKGIPKRRSPGKRPSPENTAGSSSTTADPVQEPVRAKDSFWTDDRIARIREVAGSGGSKTTAANLLGVTKTRIAYQAQKHGIKFPAGSQTASGVFTPGTLTGYRPSGVTLRTPVGKVTPAAKPDMRNQTPAGRHGPQWPEDRLERLRRLVAEGHSVTEIGERMGMTRSAIAGKCSRLGLRIGRNCDRLSGDPIPANEMTADELTADEMKQLARHVKQGLGLTAIAATMGKPYRVIIANMEALGLSRVAA